MLLIKTKLNFEQVILLLFSLAFVLIDWKFGLMTFSDLLLIIIFTLIMVFNILNKNIYMFRSQIYLFIVITILVLCNIFLNLISNINFSFLEGFRGILKVIFYLSTSILLFNYIRENRLEEKLLKVISVTAIIVSLIGIYISISIYLNGILPYEFFWKFSRNDLESYTYRGWDKSVIRTRSIFDEPSFLGFYLNIVLTLLYSNKSRFSIKKSHVFIISFTILLTFSFSSILIMILIKLLYNFNWKSIISFLNKKRNFLFVILGIFFVILFWNQLERTILIRSQEILSGGDGSANARFQGSWSYVNWQHIFTGIGIGNSPPLFNIYAYILTDLGLVSFLLLIIFSGWLLFLNPKFGIIFIILNFQKGGYLAGGFWLFTMLLILFSIKGSKNSNL